MAERLRVAEVVPDIPPAGLEDTYTYAVGNQKIERGDCVLVPFGRRTVPGFVLEVRDVAPEELDFPVQKLRSITARVEGVSLSEELLGVMKRVADLTLSPVRAVVAAALPPGIRSRLRATYLPVAIDQLDELPQELALAYEELCKREQIAVTSLKRLGLTKEVMDSLVQNGLAQKIWSLPAERAKASELYRLAPGAESAVAEDRPAQFACVQTLSREPNGCWTIEEIAAATGVSTSTVRALVKAGVLEPAAPVPQPETPMALMPTQEAAVARVCSAKEGKFLLFGVTGSGKTEVYLRAIEQTLAEGRDVLYLVPEIALAAQVVHRLRARFGDLVGMLHSGMAQGERLRQWRAIREGKARIALGARGAAFAPCPNLGLIVVDEEHEAAYKEDGSPHHDARRVAELRAEASGARLILGSATPSLEAYYRALNGGLELLELPARVLNRSLPHVEISDLRRLYQHGKPSILGEELRLALEETLARKEQAILFLNRRAYASSLLCRECGFVPMCPNCSVSLTVHKQARRLRCHHCNLQKAIPDRCPNCGSIQVRPLGIGTEKVVEAVETTFPGCRVARLDRDVVRKAGALEEILHRLHEGDLDVLVGTQMVAKGLDFPGVTLVGVVTADTSLFIPDFRSTERTFQLITQVCGRSGRSRPGMAVIQTFQPEHPAIALGAKQDYVRFYDREIAERRDALYPPFCRLVNVVVSSEDREAAAKTAQEAADSLRRHLTRVLGPAPCAFERLKGRWRYHVLVKLDPDDDVRLARLPMELLTRRHVRVTVDVEPVSVL